MAMREHYTQLLQATQGDVVRMANQVEQTLIGAQRALQGWNTDAAAELIAGDDAIDHAQAHINDQVLRIIATQQPMATDLRVLLAATMIAGELERIADYSRGIGKSVQRAVRTPRLVDVPAGMFQMIEYAQGMLRTAINAFVKLDLKEAGTLGSLDETVDELDSQVKRELIAIMKSDSDAIECAVELLKVEHNIERTADRCTNIAERVIFIATSYVPELNP
jgi:phosphate transport system protein